MNNLNRNYKMLLFLALLFNMFFVNLSWSVSSPNLKSEFQDDRKEFYILWSMHERGNTWEEYRRLWKLVDHLSGIGYHVILNTKATNEDIQDAIVSENSSVILISAHGSGMGPVDYNYELLAHSSFKKMSSNLKQVIFATCFGSEYVQYYNIPKRVKTYTWEGLVDLNDMFELLYSDEWLAEIESK
jgi:hypothetical protein